MKILAIVTSRLLSSTLSLAEQKGEGASGFSQPPSPSAPEVVDQPLVQHEVEEEELMRAPSTPKPERSEEAKAQTASEGNGKSELRQMLMRRPNMVSIVAQSRSVKLRKAKRR